MAVDVEELIIAPFREVVARGKEAAANAEAAREEDPALVQQMMKSAQAVSKEGERALKRLQPLWDGQVEKHGDCFKDMIGDSDDLAEKRRLLEELLYDFEDFIDADTFDASKFAEVQAATKSFALDILDFIKRVKVENKTPTTPTPTHAFPPLPPLPPLPPGAQPPRLNSQSGPVPAPPSRSGSFGTTANFSLFPASGRPAKPPHAAHRSGARGMSGSSDSTTLRRAPSSAKSVASDARSSRHVILEATTAQVVPARREEARRPSSPDVLGDEGEQARMHVVSPIESPGPLPRTSDWVDEQISAPRPRRQMRDSIPENSAVTTTHALTTVDGAVLSRVNRIGLDSGTPQGSMFDPTSPSTTSRTSVYSDSPVYSPANGLSPKTRASDARSSSLSAMQLEPIMTGTMTAPGQYSDGLMLANEQLVPEPSDRQVGSISIVSEEDRQIGAKSSFHHVKGFCDGAQAFRRGGYWDGLKQTMTYGEPLPIGRCLNCEYYHVYNELTLDKEGDSRANFLKFGLLYRMRFLIKSHVPARTTSEIRYACLFCTHVGHTVHEGDATVFLTADQLLKHLARHPQPLPEVPGVTVLYGKLDGGHHQIEDYDVHFPSPPAPSPFPDAASLLQMPIATALKSHVQRWGEVLADPDGGGDVLKFLTGARIIGVEFPEKWGGKWCTGLHDDGVRRPFPAKHVEIEGPRQSEISLQATSPVSVVTRWKWDPPDSARTGWLTFGKGETIKNVGWLYQDHWCWSGTNSKGKFGIFPRSHINLHSLKKGVAFSGARRPQTSGPMRLFSRRRPSTGSSRSGDT
ncbi:sh3 domain containing protein [Colletotrichum musicola]|uniref:Sh3 domain containing protein n=1 Tax=Colletotrichum musicola TaxID=2175873 RepID=A0A8H6KH92_9PEZI|nr:sh3 domain containing protein [Colletotrichum musicola]